MQLSRLEDSSQEAHDGQLGQPQTQDGGCREHVVPENSFGPFRVGECCPMLPSGCCCVQIDNQCCRQPQVDLKMVRSVI